MASFLYHTPVSDVSAGVYCIFAI